MANLKAIEVVTEKSGDASGFMVGTDSFAVPVGDLIDVADALAVAICHAHSNRLGKELSKFE